MASRLRFPALLVAPAILLASCGAKGPPPVSTLPHEPVRMAVSMPALPQSKAECPSMDVAEQEGKVNILWMAPDIWPNLEQVVSEFENQYPGIHVVLYQVAESRYFEASRDILASGCTTPDVLNIEMVQSAYYAAYQWLAPLWNQYTFDEKEDWIQASRKSGRYAQEQYSAPFSTSTSLLFYNADIFKKVGLATPAQNERWTWEELSESAKKLTLDENQDGVPDIWGFAWEENSPYLLASLAQSLGGAAIGEDGVTVRGIIDATPWVEALTFYQRLFKEWRVAPQNEGFSPVDAFIDGDLAMFAGSARNIDQIDQARLNWGIMLYPYFEKGKVVIPSGDWQIGVNAKTGHLEAAMELVTWLTTRSGAEVLWRQGQVSLPAVKSVLNLVASAAEIQSPPALYWKTAASEALRLTLPGAVTPYYAAYDLRLREAFKNIRDGMDPQAVLTQAAADLAAQLK